MKGTILLVNFNYPQSIVKSGITFSEIRLEFNKIIIDYGPVFNLKNYPNNFLQFLQELKRLFESKWKEEIKKINSPKKSNFFKILKDINNFVNSKNQDSKKLKEFILLSTFFSINGSLIFKEIGNTAEKYEFKIRLFIPQLSTLYLMTNKYSNFLILGKNENYIREYQNPEFIGVLQENLNPIKNNIYYCHLLGGELPEDYHSIKYPLKEFDEIKEVIEIIKKANLKKKLIDLSKKDEQNYVYKIKLIILNYLSRNKRSLEDVYKIYKFFLIPSEKMKSKIKLILYLLKNLKYKEEKNED